MREKKRRSTTNRHTTVALKMTQKCLALTSNNFFPLLIDVEREESIPLSSSCVNSNARREEARVLRVTCYKEKGSKKKYISAKLVLINTVQGKAKDRNRWR